MTGKTHMAIGVASAAAFLSTSNPTPQKFIIGLSLGMMGALMPDIDIKTSKISSFGRTVLAYIFVILAVAGFVVYKGNIHLNQIKFSYKPNSMIEYGAIVILSCVIFSKLTKHRSFSHSILGLILFYVGFRLLIGEISTYFAIGFISHIAADLITNNGVELLYPMKSKMSLKLVKSGSKLDYIIGTASFALFVYITIKTF
ncbi:metal-dependent hydrolase [Clostridium neuense]|uniref:Metal-dependent hydrolase n=1 Tax=Clostridium neuense TaxID=1728934 RepID=A0ABW8TIH7_9CLOT